MIWHKTKPLNAKSRNLDQIYALIQWCARLLRLITQYTSETLDSPLAWSRSLLLSALAIICKNMICALMCSRSFELISLVAVEKIVDSSRVKDAYFFLRLRVLTQHT